MIKRVVLVIFLVILTVLLTACTSSIGVTVTVTPSEQTVTTTVTTTATVTATVEPTATPATFTGNSDKTTPPFSIDSAEWTIEWSYTTSTPQYAGFYIYVYQRGDSLPILSISDAKSQGSTYSYAGPGEYYLEVSCANIDSWTVTVRPVP